MVSVGKVYRSDGNINLKDIKWDIKLKMLFTYMVENSSWINGKKIKLLVLREKQRQQKIKDYTDAFTYHLLRGRFKDSQKIVMTFDSEDLDIVQLVLSSPLFLQYRTTYIDLNHNLKEMGAYVNYVVEIERLV